MRTVHVIYKDTSFNDTTKGISKIDVL